MGEPTPLPQYWPPWAYQATMVLVLINRGQLSEAVAAVEQIQADHGPGVLPAVLVALCDTTLAAAGHRPARPRQVSLAFTDLDRRDLSAGEVPPNVAWAGRLVAARAADDRETFEALIAAAMADEEAWGRAVMTLFRLAAKNVKHWSTTTVDVPEQGGRADG